VIQGRAVISMIAADGTAIKKGIAGGQLLRALHAMSVARVIPFTIMVRHARQAVVQVFVVEAVVFLHVLTLLIHAIAIPVVVMLL